MKVTRAAESKAHFLTIIPHFEFHNTFLSCNATPSQIQTESDCINFQTSHRQHQHNAEPPACHVHQLRMDLWHKLRRTWSLVPSLFKLRKSLGGGAGGGSGGNGNGAGGLLKLRDDVEMCGYRDVQVMWHMLSIKQTQKMEGRGRVRVKVKVKVKRKPGKRSSKQRPVCRIFFWTNHSP